MSVFRSMMTRRRLHLLALLCAAAAVLLGLAPPAPAAVSGLRVQPHAAALAPAQFFSTRTAPDTGAALKRRTAPGAGAAAIRRARDEFWPLEAPWEGAAGGEDPASAALPAAASARGWGRDASLVPAASAAPPVFAPRRASAGPSSPRAPPAASR